MSIFLYNDDEEASAKVNIDELFERKQQRDLKQLSIFNKILARCQKRIQLTARNKRSDQYIWFQVPEYIFGEPIYDKGDCIAYIVMKLQNNGFHVRYMHPNTIFVSWANYIPSYVRSEFKKKTGKMMDEKGNVTDHRKNEDDDENDSKEIDINAGLLNNRNMIGGDDTQTQSSKKDVKQFTPIGNYKPTGKFVYDPNVFESLEKKLG
jgi:hypothetical protein